MDCMVSCWEMFLKNGLIDQAATDRNAFGSYSSVMKPFD